MEVKNFKAKRQFAFTDKEVRARCEEDICFRNKDILLHTPEHNIIGGIERDCAIALQQIKELKQDD